MFQEYFLYLAIVLLFLDLQRLFLNVKNQDEKFNTSMFHSENGLF